MYKSKRFNTHSLRSGRLANYRKIKVKTTHREQDSRREESRKNGYSDKNQKAQKI